MNTITDGIQNINIQSSKNSNSYSLDDLLSNMNLNEDIESSPEDDIEINHIIDNIFHNNFDIFDNMENIQYIGIPNIYCKSYFDDEDFLYRKITLPKKIKNIIMGNQTLNKYVLDMITQTNIIINYSLKQTELSIIFLKTIYIYQFSEYYFNTLAHYNPKERLTHIPNDILQWVDNVVDSLREIYDDNNKIFLEFNSLNCHYLDEVLYGLQLIITRLKMFLNHHRNCNLPLYAMEEKYVEGFMTAINNMCCIVILLCYGKRHSGGDEYYTSSSEEYNSESEQSESYSSNSSYTSSLESVNTEIDF